MSGSKIASIVLSLLALGVFVFWWIWVRAPSPAQICQHKIELVLAEVPQDQREGAEALIDRLELRCIESAEKKIQLRGKLVYAEYARCVAKATSLSEAEQC